MVWESISVFHDIFVVYYIFLYVSTNILFKKPQTIGLCDGFYLVLRHFVRRTSGWPFEGESMMVFVQTQMGDISNIQLPDDDQRLPHGEKGPLSIWKSLLRSVKKSARGAVQRKLNNDATDKLTEWLLLLRPTAMLAWLPLLRWISRFACHVSSKDTSPWYSKVLIGMLMGYGCVWK